MTIVISEYEMLDAVKKTREKFPHLCSDMSRLVVKSIESYKEADKEAGIRREFGEYIRKALNQFEIRDNRKAYASLVGHYFGLRGNRKSRLGQPAEERPHSPSVEIEFDENGQGSFVLL